ncbi:Copper-binding family protein [Heracleum sosnowskyi]|uniref:Copper-binding family protein n=1 Tax=Heracleum sosnowskyi TaxID=360622 RepID=A0AAD8N5E9_9APIA|nr:Copper-binding family protein [Heracleum sosnowskyi]
MGEEKKEEEKKEEASSGGGGGEEKKEEEKKEDEPLVLKVEMHCEACAKKVAKSLKGFQGVEEVMADCKGSKVVVKGKAVDPMKVCERIQKKSGRKVEIISPLPKPPEENKGQETKPEEPPKEDKKDEPPPVITLVLKIGMHCEACSQLLQKRIRKIKGVEAVTTDLANDQVTVKGVLDPEKLVTDIYKKTKKQATVVKDEAKKEEEKKEEEKKVEEKKEEKKEEEAKEDEDNKAMEMRRSEYYGPKYYTEYSSAPELFSDENPNACSVM